MNSDTLDSFLAAGHWTVIGPRLAITLGLIVAGFFLAAGLNRSIRWFADKIGLNEFAERVGVNSILERAGGKEGLGALLGSCARLAVVILVFAGIADAWGLRAMADLGTALLNILPKLIIAATLAVLGVYLADFVRALIRSRAEGRKDFESGDFAGSIAYYLILALSLTFALEQAGLDTSLAQSLLLLIVATTSAALGLAFAIGSRDVVSGYVCRFFMERLLRPGDRISFSDIDGTIVAYGPVSVVVQVDDDRIVVPCTTVATTCVRLRGLGASLVVPNSADGP